MKSYRISHNRSWLAAVILAVILTAPTADALAADLELLGSRWEKPVVTFQISTKGGISASAIADVVQAIDDWNAALQNVPGAPTLTLVTRRNQADVTIDLRAKETRNVFGGQTALQGGYWSLPETEGCTLVAQSFTMQGYVLTDPRAEGYPQTRNLARHLVGHALGLGDIAGPNAGTIQDAMRPMGTWESIPATDLAISECDLDGIAAVYSAASCEQIPSSVAFDCN